VEGGETSKLICILSWVLEDHNNNNKHSLPLFLVQFYQLVSELRSRSRGTVNGDEGEYKNGDTHGSHGEGNRRESRSSGGAT